jgi:hypothetical protein
MEMYKSLRVVVLCSAFAAPAVAHAQQSDDLERHIVQRAIENIHKLLCGDRPCAPATAEELKTPPITLPEGWSIIVRGTLSGMAQVCKLEWQRRNYLPMMAYWRRQGKDHRQMALVGFIHGFAQQQSFSRLSECDADRHSALERVIDFKP